jgi:Na+/phosphate symporter
MAATTDRTTIVQMLFSIQISILGIAVITIGTATFSSAWVFFGLLIVVIGVVIAGVTALGDLVESIDTV